MRFPKSELDRDGYLKDLHTTLTDEACIIFLDTNILARFYSFNSVARSELRAYLKGFIDKNRLKVPAWVMNEYSKHFIRKKTNQYYDTAGKISTIIKEFKTFSSFAKMFVEDAAASKEYGYSDAAAFQADLDDIQRKLDNFSKIRSIKADYAIVVHKELEALLSDTVLDTDIFQLAQNIQIAGKGRYTHEIPPGFEDGSKKKNSFGDLIAWQEMLSHCKVNSVRKVVILTNDEKRDWLYAPQKLLHKGKRVPNANDEFKIADPRLVYEFKMMTSSEDLFIVNLSTLASATLEAGDRSLIKVAEALQIQGMQAHGRQNDGTSDIATMATIATTTTITQLPPKDGQEAQAVDEHKNPRILKTSETSGVPYSADALADVHYTQFVSPEIGAIVGDLKSYNWYVQNPAIVRFRQLDFGKLGEVEKLRDDLFVLGRNIYQAACGGAFEAVHFVENIEALAVNLPSTVNDHIVCGIYYELYFDSFNQLRKGAFKIVLIDAVFRIFSNELFKSSTLFIGQALKSFADFLLVTPVQEITPIHIVIDHDRKDTIENDSSGLFNQIEITSMKYLKEELLVNTVNAKWYSPFLSKNEIKSLLSRIFAVPEIYLNLEFPESRSSSFYCIPDKKAIWRGPLPDAFTKSGLSLQ